MKIIEKNKQELLTVCVNGREQTARCDGRTTLLDFLRVRLSLTGTHAGCEHGVCGACTVMVNGSPVRSCLGFAHQFHGAQITTVEGLSQGAAYTDLQVAFSRHHALQCGFCTPGFLIVAEDLLRRIPEPTQEQIREEIAGNLCRCTGYAGIVDAILEVSQQRKKLQSMGEQRV